MSQNPVDPAESPNPQPKGVWVCGAIFADALLSPVEKFLVAEIDTLTHAEKACYASNHFLAGRLHLSETRIRDMLADLTAKGYLIRLAFNGRVALRCVHPLFSANPSDPQGLIEKYGVELPKERPPHAKKAAADPHESSTRENTRPKRKCRKVSRNRESSTRENTSPVSEGEVSCFHETLIERTGENRERTTTTTPPAPAEAAPASGHEVVVVSSGSGAFEAEEKRRDETLEALKTEFRLNPGQANKVRRIAKGKGLAYLEERVSYTRGNAKKNRTAYLLKLLHEDAQITVELDRKAKRSLKPEPKPEAAPSEPQADFSAELTWWQSATEAQKEDLLRDPRFDLFRKSMRKGVTAASLGLPVLREVLAELARKAACAAAEMAKAQPPEQKAA